MCVAVKVVLAIEDEVVTAVMKWVWLMGILVHRFML